MDNEPTELPFIARRSSNHDMNKFIAILTFLIIFTVLDVALGQHLTGNVITRVFLIRYGTEMGSSFTIEVDQRQYLVTAKHLVSGIVDGDEIYLRRSDKWEPIKVKVINCEPQDLDISVLVLPMQISPTLPLDPTMDKMILGQEIYFLGFPYGMSNKSGNMNNWFPLPFIKKGILSAIDSRPNGYSVIYVDGHNNPGFSGGPVVFYHSKTKHFRVAAVVSSYKNQIDKVFLLEGTQGVNMRRRDTNLFALTNSGILRAYSIDPAIEAIKKRPIGPRIKPK